MKLCSLFDGSGGFPLAGSFYGIEPVVASEIEPYPIAVTRSRFPKMVHVGDVSKVNGADIEPCNIISFGSPCQDLSVAGKRAGMKHEGNGDDETTRSGLFMEAIRIIKEMRGATDGRLPTFAIWENVPGAFTSNNREDFRVVLEEFARIVDPTAKVPPADERGWPRADVLLGDGWSVAYRTFDAQHWGVPQCRRRIYLVADFRGERAGTILFEREGLSGDPLEGGAPWERTPGDIEGRAGEANREVGEQREGKRPDNLYTLGIDRAAFNQGRNAQYDFQIKEELSATIVAKGPNAVCYGPKWKGKAHPVGIAGEVSNTIDACYYKGPGERAFVEREIVAVDDGAGEYIVRRLTPLECGRLQGFPDGWGEIDHKESMTPEEVEFWRDVRKTHAEIEGKAVKDWTADQILRWYNGLHTDTAEYKMWGNGIALPCARYVMEGLAIELEKEGGAR